MTNAGGASVWALEARPFGDSENVTGTATLNLRFPGQYYDDESGMNYNYLRTYRPELGRYMKTDPVGLAGGTPNLYEYAFNNPVNWVDPLGLTGEQKKKDCPKCSDSPDDAAKKWCKAPYGDTGRTNWSVSMANDIEYCSYICKKQEGGKDCYFSTPAKPGSSHNPDQCRPKPCPPGSTPAGRVHTHRRGPFGYPDSNNPMSPGDKWNSYNEGIPSYMANWRGDMSKYDWSKGGDQPPMGSCTK